MNRLILFPQDFHTDEHPHSAIVNFITNWINTNHNRNYPQPVNDIKHDLNQLFISEFPGFGLEADGTITGFYDPEWMPEEGIKKFKTGESFIVTFDDQDTMFFPQVRYSRKELSGWFSLALERYMERFPDLKEPISKIENNYYSPSEAKKNLIKKIKGELKWVYGACGKLTSEQVDSWVKNYKEI